MIITTHYIEEARLANLVAFMRHGTLLEEGNPESLIRRLKLNNLEEVFLALCRPRKTEGDEESSAEKGKSLKKPLLGKGKATDECSIQMVEKRGSRVHLEEEEELLSVSFPKVSNGEEEGEEVVASSSSSTLPATVEQCTDIALPLCLKTQEDVEQEVEVYAPTTAKASPVNTSSPLRSPTSPIFSHTQQHRKMQDAQVMANRLQMKRNKILDHFARSSALLTKNFIRMWRNLPVMLFTAFIPAVQCKLAVLFVLG